MPRITPNLWFDHQAEEAAAFYVSVFPDSAVGDVLLYGDAGPGEPGTVMTVDFTLSGQRCTAINGGPLFPFTEAISLLVDCADQAEIDYYWTALSAGGQESRCGWLKDRYGLSWQVVPEAELGILKGPDPARAQRAMAAVLGMGKLDIAAIRAAADGP